ncbi:MAG: triple tyrosine motif-containing protein [Bacteroidia bacterium]
MPPKPLFNPSGEAFVFVLDTLYRFEPEARRFRPLVVVPPGFACVQSYMFTRDGRLWAFNDVHDLLRIDLQRMVAQSIRLIGREEVTDAMGNVALGYEDRNHNIWLTTSGFGLMKISGRSELFRRIPTRIPKMDRAAYLPRVVSPLSKALYDPKVRANWLAVSPRIRLRDPGMILATVPKPLLVDKAGNFICVALRPEPITRQMVHLLRIDAATASIEVLDSMVPLGEGFQSFLFIDHRERIWSTIDVESRPAFYCYDLQAHVRRVFPCPQALPNHEVVFVQDWYEGPSGRIWMATNIGLYSVDPQTGVTATFLPKVGDPNALSSEKVLCVQGDPRAPDRLIWIGTSGAGLDALDAETGHVHHFTTADGLPNNVIYGILFDGQNHLWLSTNKGISHFDPLTRTIRNYGKGDGLVGNEFNHMEFSMAANGEMYFGGIKGVTYFQPEDFHRQGRPDPVVIHQLKLDNAEVPFQRASEEGAEQLRTPMEYLPELIFPHDHKMISIGFTLLDLSVPSMNRFRYRLVGLSDTWIDAGTAQEAIYSGLSPGGYTFEVIGCNSHDAWSAEPTRLKITILPPWWATWWFRVLLVFTVAGAAYGLYRYRLQQLLKVERMRNRIGQDLHDEIGSTLSSIGLYSAVMQRTSDNLPPQTLGILDKIIGSTSQMMESMNDIVWTIKASNDGFEHVVNRMRAFGVNMTETSDIELRFEVDPQVEKLSLGMEQRKNIYLIYKEAVNNAVKYAQCTRLEVGLRKVGGRLQMTIKDNGVGFHADDKAGLENRMGGNGLSGMQARASAIGAELEIASSAGKGTCISLQVGI